MPDDTRPSQHVTKPIDPYAPGQPDEPDVDLEDDLGSEPNIPWEALDARVAPDGTVEYDLHEDDDPTESEGDTD